jgi:hypothetical protein
MPEGVEVRPEDLRRGAGRLRDDASHLGLAGAQAVDGVLAASGAAGDGPLSDAATTFAERVDALVRAVSGSVTDCAAALDAAWTQYLATDQAAGLGAGGAPTIVLPGLEPPR